MEKHEKDLITAKGPELLEEITVNDQFVVVLKKYKILSLSEIDEITTRAGNTAKVAALLDILRRKTTGFPVLIEVLTATQQDGALKVLETKSETETSILAASATSPNIASDSVVYSSVMSTSTKIVGNDDCRFATIVMAVEDSEAAEAVLEKDWKKVADTLGVSPARKAQLAKESAIEAFEQILIDWRSRESSNAKLSLLIELLEKRKLNDLAAVLKPLL